MRGLAGRVAVVTGAAGGIGAATARRLAEEGASVVAVDLDEARVRDLAASLPSDAIGVRADVSREDDVAAYVEAAVARFGRIDLHHLNAGIPGSFATLPSLSVEDFDRVMAVNVRGVFLGLRAAFRRYADQKSAGNVVITGSIGSLRGSADLLAYQTSKHAVVGLLRGAAMYGGPLGVRVNAVAPGIVPTDLFAANAVRGGGPVAGGKDDMSRRAASTPLRRAGTAEDVAGVVAFLLSDDAAYMTGELVSVDGGASIVSTVRPSGGAGAWDFESYDRALYSTRW
ncbi:SDR family NAD(P)-dependent oxidoreductase [Actinoplanes sp. NPDC049265]|uniref:SDR family NAD(P)-dependent oxidoreductase n=1 Tax=Actinoplanes sp. NPDC049265 TaxID=3363902 RepID=UPI003718AA35